MVKSSKKYTGNKVVEKSNAHNHRTALDCKSANTERKYTVGAGVIDNELWTLYYSWDNSYNRQNQSRSHLDGSGDYNNTIGYFVDGTSVEYNNDIYCLGSSYSGSEKFGQSIKGSYCPELPQNYKFSPAVACDGKIHLFGGETDGTSHYTWKTGDSAWTLLSTPTPINMKYGLAVVRQSTNHIHILNSTKHYELNSSGVWVEKGTLPFDVNTILGYTIVSKGSNIHVFHEFEHYVWDGNSWLNYADLPIAADRYSFAVLQDDKIALVGGEYSERLVYYLLNW